MASMMEPSQPGKREFFLNRIVNADKGKHPIIARMKRGASPYNTLMKWQADNYPAPSLTSITSSAPATLATFIGDREVIENYLQKTRRTVGVDDLAQDVSNVAGLGEYGEMANQVNKGIYMVSRDIESAAACYNQDAAADNGTTGYYTRCIGTWGNSTAGTVLPVPASYLPPATNTTTTVSASITANTVATVMASIASQARGPLELTCFAGPTLKRALSLLQSADTVNTTSAIRRVQEEQGTVVQEVEIIRNDFGVMEIVLDYFVGLDTASAGASIGSAFKGFVMDMKMWEIGWRRMPTVKELPDLDGGKSAAISAIWGLVCLNPLTVGGFNGAS